MMFLISLDLAVFVKIFVYWAISTEAKTICKKDK